MHTNAPLNSLLSSLPLPFSSNIPKKIAACSLGCPSDTNKSSTSEVSTVPLPSVSMCWNAAFRTLGSHSSGPSPLSSPPEAGERFDLAVSLAVSLWNTSLILSPSLAVVAEQSTPSLVHTEEAPSEEDSCWPPAHHLWQSA